MAGTKEHIDLMFFHKTKHVVNPAYFHPGIWFPVNLHDSMDNNGKNAYKNTNWSIFFLNFTKKAIIEWLK